MANEQLKKFAEELKIKREEKGLTIKDLHTQTRIDEKYLEAIEAGNFSLLPEVYIRAFIREYAAEIDLDPDETIKKYDLAKSGFDFEQTEEPGEQQPEEETKTPKTDFSEEKPKPEIPEKPKQNLTALYSAVAVVLLGLILYFALSGSDEEIIVETKYEAPKTTETIASVKTGKTNETTEYAKKENSYAETSAAPENPFSLKLVGTDTVWVRAKIDENKTEEFMLYPEISRIIDAKNTVSLIIGNSAGVEIFIDGKQIEFSGEKGKVRNLTLTKEGLKTKR